MIPCNKCGSDNLVGAIFCRSCGAKLNIEEIRPKTLNQQAPPSSLGHIATLVWRLIVIGALVIVGGIFFGLFLKASGYQPCVMSDADMAAACRQYEDLFVPKAKATTVTFTGDQVQAILNKEMGLTKKEGDAGWALAPEELSINLLASGYIRIVLQSKLKGKFSVYSTLIGSLEKGDRGYEFRIFKAKMGRIGLPGAKFIEVIKGRFDSVFADYGRFAQLQPLLSEVTVSAESVEVKLKATAAPPPPARRSAVR